MKLCIKINNCLDLIKSYGIRDRSGLVPRKVPVKGKYGYYTKTVYVRPELIENPEKHTYKEHPEEYDEDLPKLLDELKHFDFNGMSEEEVFEMTRKMGKANSMAFKGDENRFTPKEIEINNKIYPIKEEFTENLAEYYVKNKLNAKWLVVNKGEYDDVLYVRDNKSGIQISFHGYKNKKNVDIEITNDESVWDGVENAFEYSKEEYQIAKQRKNLRDIFKNDYINFVSNYFNTKLKETFSTIINNKRVENMLQNDKKKGMINDKSELEIGIKIYPPTSWKRDRELFIDNYIGYMKDAKMIVEINNHISDDTKETIVKFIYSELGKKGISLRKLLKDNFNEIEKEFILGEIKE